MPSFLLHEQMTALVWKHVDSQMITGNAMRPKTAAYFAANQRQIFDPLKTGGVGEHCFAVALLIFGAIDGRSRAVVNEFRVACVGTFTFCGRNPATMIATKIRTEATVLPANSGGSLLRTFGFPVFPALEKRSLPRMTGCRFMLGNRLVQGFIARQTIAT